MTLRDVLLRYGVKVAPEGHDHHRPGWLNTDCPDCGLREHYRLGFSLSFGSANCWACGPKNPAWMLSRIASVPYKEAQEAVEGLVPSAPPPDRLRGTYKPPKGLGELLPAHKAYLRKRKFDVEEVVRLWGVQGIGHGGGSLKWRLFLPVHVGGTPVSWTTRSLVDTGLRYVSAAPDQEALNHRTLLYGEDYCRHAVVVHEGPTDVWATGPGAVCTFGTAFTRGQVRRLASYPVRAVCFDSMPDAQRQAERLVRMLSAFPGETSNIVLETGKDTASASPSEVEELRRAFLV